MLWMLYLVLMTRRRNFTLAGLVETSSLVSHSWDGMLCRFRGWVTTLLENLCDRISSDGASTLACWAWFLVARPRLFSRKSN